MVQPAPRARRPGRILARLLVPLLLLGVAAAIYLIVTSPSVLGKHASPPAHAAAHRRIPPYWTVKTGDTFAGISAATGVSIAQLQAYNPTVNSFALVPGERLQLWAHPPQPHKPKAKPLGPTFWTVKPGESFGSIAAATKIDITTLEQLNPHIKPSAIQPGERIRLHR